MFSANQTASDSKSDVAFAVSTLISQKGTLDVHLPADHPAPPTVCFFSLPSFKGEVYCLGIGGANFTSNLVGKAQSLTLSPDLAAWIYPQYYSNPQGTYVSTNMDDLSSIPYQTHSSFKNPVVAARIYRSEPIVDMNSYRLFSLLKSEKSVNYSYNL